MVTKTNQLTLEISLQNEISEKEKIVIRERPLLRCDERFREVLLLSQLQYWVLADMDCDANLTFVNWENFDIDALYLSKFSQ